MLNCLLQAEDMLKGLFPKVALEILYVNLYNLSKLRDVEKLIDTWEKKEFRAETHDLQKEERLTPPQRDPEPVRLDRSAQGFVEYLKKKMPSVGNMLDSHVVSIEGDTFIVIADKQSHALFRHRGEEIKHHLTDFFGKTMKYALQESGDTKKNTLVEYVREAETLFHR
jgi:hypothetical protein